jgi:AcrR family transcriptional regulator
VQAGRPRNTDVTDRVIQEAASQILAGGYAALSVEDIAMAAGTSRTAIYRRWSNKADLAAAAIASVAEVEELPETGSLRDDLAQYVMQNARNQSQANAAAAPALVWATILDPEVLPRYMEQIGNARRQIGRQIIAMGIERGELPEDVDGDLILDALAGFVLFRSAVAHKSTSVRDVERVIFALCENPPRLTE